MKYLDPLTWNCQLSIQINILLFMTNLKLLSVNGYSLSHHKNIPIHQNPPKIYLSWPSKATPFFKFKNGGISYFLSSDNIYKQKISYQHKNLSENNITTYILFSSNQPHIQNFPHQRKTMKHSQEHSAFILLNITPFPHQNHQNCMSKSLHTWIMKMYFIFLLLLSLPWVIN